MKFNEIIKSLTPTKNHAGAPAFKMSPEMELYTAVVTSSLSPTFYERESDRLKRIRELMAKVEPVFVAKLAVYARQEMNLRSLPLVLVTELAKIHQGDDLVRKATRRVIQRADEITELLACFQTLNHRKGEKKLNKLSKQMQKGISDAFNRFDEYQFAKYNRKTVVSLKDALFLTHPKAKDENQQALFSKIVNDGLQVPYTWEVELSGLGQLTFATAMEKYVAFREKWEELIFSEKLGYMALMRNLRNMLEAGVRADALELVAKRLADPVQVARSRQLPFRFLSAYRELQPIQSGFTGMLLEALEGAMQASAQNIPGFDAQTRVVIASDVSGSMFKPVSPNSKIQFYDIGLVMSMLLQSRCRNVITGIFGSDWKEVNLPKNSILANTMHLRKIEGTVGYSTNGWKVINHLIQRKYVADKVMFFTDLQMWDSSGGSSTLKSSWDKYRAQVAPEAKLYLFDLLGYGKPPIRIEQKGVHLLAGWSDKVFEVLKALDQGGDALGTIESIEL
ncbi:MAG: TROVE domain-containing protein [Bacteroidia bacterium]|nr:TROVE domain-containing protein [Bacteroidia bacterium]